MADEVMFGEFIIGTGRVAQLKQRITLGGTIGKAQF